ncbi:hypothetical protein DOY81_013558 [Sarcophaga bullata]|nr:hypothetical protein DOY81_013558 [Sarcophaga bullata]
MSGQYPGGYNNPLGGHRGQFNPQQQQQMMNQMQMGSSGAGNMMAGAGGGPGGGMMGMGGGVYGQGGMIPQQQQQQQQQILMQMGPNSSQMVMGMPGVGMGPSSVAVRWCNNPQVGNIMQQQQMQAQMQQNVGMQQGHQMQTGPGGPNIGAMMVQQQSQQSPQQQQAQQLPQTSGPQSQQQQQNVQQPTSSSMLIPQQPHKEINIVTLSRVGQETVQDITSRFQEIFTALKVIQPTASRDNGTVKKVQEHFRTIRLLFKRMRLIYEWMVIPKSLIPYKDETEHRNLEGTQCEEYRKALQENQELIETVKLKNRQLREIIERTRIIVWEINTMLSMRRS